jgi:hypothetical protein
VTRRDSAPAPDILAPLDEIAPGIWHWTARHPKIGIDVSSYYLGEPAVLIDPMSPPGVLDRLAQLGPPREILLTNRHHFRDCATVVARFDCPVRASRPGMHEFAGDSRVQPFDFGDEVAGGAVVAYEVGAICPDETALHAPALRALAVADGVIHYGDEISFVPDHYMDDPPSTKRALKEAYRRLVDELDFTHLLLAHGTPIVDKGRDELSRFASAD